MVIARRPRLQHNLQKTPTTPRTALIHTRLLSLPPFSLSLSLSLYYSLSLFLRSLPLPLSLALSLSRSALSLLVFCVSFGSN